MRGRWVPLLGLLFGMCQARCVMTGCSGEMDSDHPPFFPHHWSRLTHPDDIDRLEQYCSHLIHDESSATVCCTGLQLKGLTDRLSKAATILASCPSCFDNFANLWCQFTCSPKQSDFMTVRETSGGNVKEIVERMEYRVGREFAEGLFESCRHTWFANGLAIRLMSSEGKVSFENFYRFMGAKNLDQNIPMSMDFQFSGSEKAMNVPITPCYKSAGPNVPSCGVNDCPTDSRQLLDLSKVEKLGKKVFTLHFPEFEWILKICGCVALTILIVFVLKYSCHKSPAYDGPSGCYVEVSQGNIENLFEDSCEWYAEVHIGPVHRIEQVFINLPPDAKSMFSVDLYREVSELQAFINLSIFHFEIFTLIESIQNLTAIGSQNVTFSDICYRPLGNKFGCTILSPTNYFQNSWNTFENAGPPTVDDEIFDDQHWEHLKYCIRNPLQTLTYSKMSCFGEFGGPIDPVLVFGGSDENIKGAEKATRTLMILIPVSGPEEKSLIWESAFIDMMVNYRMEHANFTFMAESSVTDELQKEVDNDKLVSVMACAVVLIWVFTMLGSYHWPESSFLSALVHQKLTIAISAVIFSVISVWCSIGVFSLFDVHATDNAIVVLFFVITCIGINRIFVTVRTFQASGHCYGSPNMSQKEMQSRITETMRRSIPTVLTSSLICSTCFFLAGGVPPYVSVKMPAVEVFARHAGLAMLFDTAFYLLLMLPLFQYDARREMAGRCEIWPWYRLHSRSQEEICAMNANGSLRSPVDWFKHAIAPLIHNKWCRAGVLGMFSFTLIGSVYCTLMLEYGFDQTMAFSKSSYLSRHFENLNENLNIGPPVWFVVEGDVQWHDEKVQRKFCTLAGCDENSMGNTIRSLAFAENYPGNFLHGDVYIWLDSFLQFMHPRGTCCKTNGNNFCE
uniref:SSD domain-containing protein n=1 Tax=Caenorhabditis japonica TaxID=281687 RepID=A0A8R1ILH0_CAEJA